MLRLVERVSFNLGFFSDFLLGIMWNTVEQMSVSDVTLAATAVVNRLDLKIFLPLSCERGKFFTFSSLI